MFTTSSNPLWGSKTINREISTSFQTSSWMTKGILTSETLTANHNCWTKMTTHHLLVLIIRLVIGPFTIASLINNRNLKISFKIPWQIGKQNSTSNLALKDWTTVAEMIASFLRILLKDCHLKVVQNDSFQVHLYLQTINT